MMVRDAFGVYLGSTAVEYRDGAEQRILDLLLDARDRSDGSDELARRIDDWPTLYHLSGSRANILRPIDVRPGDRVLEVGAGTGVLTRWLAERGARVTAVEGSAARAQAIAVRCQGLEGVTVVAGTTADIDPVEQFDLVVVIGVLEHTAGGPDGDEGPRRFMEGCVAHIAPGGALVLAIENQLGLKYVLGYDEDHQGAPWIGVEDYPNGGPRTWSRQVLRRFLEDFGLSAQRWLFPFPDYKLPTVVLADSLYCHPDAADVVDLFVRTPSTADAGAASFVCDVRAAHRVMVEAGLGQDVANSFLVVAGRDDDAVRRAARSGDGWYFGGARERRWQRRRRLEVLASGDIEIVPDEPGAPTERAVGWLHQSTEMRQPVIVGVALDRLLDDAMDRGDLGRVASLLTAWYEWLTARSAAPSSDASHPFAPTQGELSLPPDHLDVSPSNFVMVGDRAHYVDAEWVLSGPVSLRLVVIRALRYYAEQYVLRGTSTPWGSTASVELLCELLAGLVGVTVTPHDLVRLRGAEAVLQEIVTGLPRHEHEARSRSAGATRPIDVFARNLPVARLRAELDRSRSVLRSLEDQLGEARALYESALDELAASREQNAALRDAVPRVARDDG